MRAGLPSSRAGSDRWLVSYADLMTVLFAFSMTLYAAGATRPTSVEAVITEPRPATVTPVVPDVPGVFTAPLSSRPDDTFQRQLTRELADAIGDRRVEIIRDLRGLVVSMPDDAAFAIGSADATPEARRLIARVGDALRWVPNPIRIEGHTDNVPIRTAKYGSNWELSTARASAVVAFLVGNVGLDAARLSAAGYGEFHPLNPNDSEAHRARNRRVDLVILDTPTPGVTGGLQASDHGAGGLPASETADPTQVRGTHARP